MATISSAGIGSGLDVNSIVTQLMALERAPLQQIQQRASSVQTRLSTVGTLKSQLATLSDAADGLANAGNWSRPTAVSGNTAAFGAAVTGSNAVPGTHRLQVKQLAAPQTLVSAPMTPGVAVGTGRLVIQMGEWSDSSGQFVAAAAPAISIDLTSGASTPEAIVAAINGSGAGVRASLLSDATGSRLMISSSATGASSGFRIGLDSGTPSSGLDGLVFEDPASATGLKRTSSAANAKIALDGIELQSTSNRFDGALPGLQINVTQATASESALVLTDDRAARRAAIDTFISAFNALAGTLATATGYNEGTKTGGTLQGDSAMLAVQSALRNTVRGARSGGTFERLSDAGISLGRDGKLAINESKLSSALDRGEAFGQLLQSSGTAGVSDGLALRVRALARALTGDQGTVTLKSAALSGQQKRLSADQERFNDRLAMVEARLRRQYTALDGSMASLSQLSGYVNQQITNWNKNTG